MPSVTMAPQSWWDVARCNGVVGERVSSKIRLFEIRMVQVPENIRPADIPVYDLTLKKLSQGSEHAVDCDSELIERPGHLRIAHWPDLQNLHPVFSFGAACPVLRVLQMADGRDWPGQYALQQMLEGNT
jgi:hypothetical protein